MRADGVHVNISQAPSPVYSAQKHERLTGAESVRTGVPVETFLGGNVGALRAMRVKSLVCRCTELPERHRKDAHNARKSNFCQEKVVSL